MSNINVRKITVDGFTSFVATIRLATGLIEFSASSEAEAIEGVEEEIRYQSASTYNPNQGMSFDEDEEDYYS